MNPVHLHALESFLPAEQINALNQLGVATVTDLAEFPPCTQADLLIRSFSHSDRSVFEWLVEQYLDEIDPPDDIEALRETPADALVSVSGAASELLDETLELHTLAELADFPPFLEARRAVEQCNPDPFCERPSAPSWLLPTPIGSTHTQVRLSNYVRDREIILQHAVTENKEASAPRPHAELIDIFTRPTFHGYFGYLASIKQQWVNAGTHLGEVVGSVALAPGESRNISIVDWRARQQSNRDEDSTASETLTNEFVQNRALNEVVQTTAKEHIFGRTDIDATTKTSGGGLTGGVGGGTGNNTTGGAQAQADLTSLIGFPLGLGGNLGHSNTQAAAGAIGGSYVFSKGSLQGSLYSETTGTRTVGGELTQNIVDATVQNAANVRSLLSTVVVEDTQTGQQAGRTQNLTNYNHSHALTIKYFEILQKYIVTTGVTDAKPVVFVPFKPFDFDIETIRHFWPILTPLLKDIAADEFTRWDAVVKDFSPQNGAFDTAGEIAIEEVTVTRNRQWTTRIRCDLTEANPFVKLEVAGFRMDDGVSLSLSGSSTHINYDILDAPSPRRFTQFSGSQDLDTDESLVWHIDTSFRGAYRRELKEVIDDAPKRSEIGRDYNELGHANSRENLKTDVDDGKYQITNGNEGLSLTLDISYQLRDRNGQRQTIQQNFQQFFSYSQLEAGTASVEFSANAAISAYLDTISNINPTREIDAIVAYFRQNKYKLTKYILMVTEKEQVVDAIEHLLLGPVPFALLIDPAPVAMADNYLIFNIKQHVDNRSLELPATQRPRRLPTPVRQSRQSTAFMRRTTSRIHGTIGKQFTYDFRVTVPRWPNSRRGLEVTGTGTVEIVDEHTLSFALEGARHQGRRVASQLSISLTRTPDGVIAEGYLDFPQNDRIKFSGQGTWPSVAHYFRIDTELPGLRGQVQMQSMEVQLLELQAIEPAVDSWIFDTQEPDSESPHSDHDVAGSSPLSEYTEELADYVSMLRQSAKQEEVFLPTPGVFGEAVLGRSNASEYINAERFYNWQDSPIPNSAPAIADLDVNVDRIRAISEELGPEVPLSVSLTPQAPQNYAMPTSLGSALEAVQNGSMFTDMSKSSELVTAAGKLADLAQAVAEKAGDLSGEAAKSALDSAVSLGNKAADVASAAATGTAPPPLTQTEKGAALNQLKKIDEDPSPSSQSGPVSAVDEAQAGVMGSPIATPQASDTGGSSDSGSVNPGNGSSDSGSGGTSTPSTQSPTTPTTGESRTTFEFLVRLFIPCPVVRFDPSQLHSTLASLYSYTPRDALLQQVSVGVKGDNRGFGYNANSFRAELICQLSFSEGTDAMPMLSMTAPPSHNIGNQVAAYHLNFGDTEEYAFNDTLAVAGQAWWWGDLAPGAQALYPPSRLTPSPANASFTATRFGQTRIDARLGINASLPATSSILALTAPEITADINFTFTWNPGNTVTVQISGLHDHFPSYEAYVDGQTIYQKPADNLMGPAGLLTVGNGSMRSGYVPQITTSVNL